MRGRKDFWGDAFDGVFPGIRLGQSAGGVCGYDCSFLESGDKPDGAKSRWGDFAIQNSKPLVLYDPWRREQTWNLIERLIPFEQPSNIPVFYLANHPSPQQNLKKKHPKRTLKSETHPKQYTKQKPKTKTLAVSWEVEISSPMMLLWVSRRSFDGMPMVVVWKKNVGSNQVFKNH